MKPCPSYCIKNLIKYPNHFTNVSNRCFSGINTIQQILVFKHLENVKTTITADKV